MAKRGGARPGAGRKKDSLLVKVRVGFWYCFVREVSRAQSDYQLNADYLLVAGERWPEGRRVAHVFGAIRNRRQMRSSKLSIPGSNQSYHVVDRVESHLQGSRAVYQHRFWEIVAPHAMSLDRIHELRTELLESMGLRRLDFRASIVLVNNVTPSHPNHPIRSNESRLRQWTEHPDLTRLGLICLFLREAVIFREYAPAARYENAVRRASRNLARHKRMRHIKVMRTEFIDLIEAFVRSLRTDALQQRVINWPNLPIVPIGKETDAIEMRLVREIGTCWNELRIRLDQIDAGGPEERRLLAVTPNGRRLPRKRPS